MIRVERAAIATSIQDKGRWALSRGLSVSGAMDPMSLEITNRLAGAPVTAAALEIGPSPLTLEVTAPGVIAFGGAPRRGAPWWQTLEVAAGAAFELSAPVEGVWSYLAVQGGVGAPAVEGSLSTCVRDGIGAWIEDGTLIHPSGLTMAPSPLETDPPEMTGRVRKLGPVRGDLTIGPRADRMGYQLGPIADERAPSDLLSEPLLPGAIQIFPGGERMILMAEAPNIGGYKLDGWVHPDDLRFVAQARIGSKLNMIQSGADPTAEL